MNRSILRLAVATILLAAALGLSACATARRAPEIAPPLPVTILFFNDTHGHLRPFKVRTADGEQEVGGIARMATLVREIREENRRRGAETRVLVAGDILQGTPMSTVFRGEADIACLNAMGVDAMTVGNHEFDFGLQNFLALREAAEFPFLSANIVYRRSRGALVPATAEFPLPGGLALTVVGVTTADLLVTTRPDRVAALDVNDPVPAARRAIDGVTARGPVVLLSHSRHETDRAIAATRPNLTAVIGGHDQILLEPHRLVGGVPIFQAFEKGRYLGRIDLEVNRGSGRARLVAHGYLPVTADIRPDPEVTAIVERYAGRLSGRFDRVVGHSPVFLDAGRERVRYEESALGNLVADLMRAHTGADAALVNSGSLRASVPAGPVTLGDLYRAMPFANQIVVVELTGREILRVLERSFRGDRYDEDGGFLQISGLRVRVRGHAPERVLLVPGDLPLNPGATYRVAVNAFMAAGGDGYTLLAGRPAHNTRLPLRELLVDAFRRGEVTAGVDGRIERLAP